MTTNEIRASRFSFRVWDEKCQEYIERDCNECSIRFDGRLVANVYVDDGYAGRYDYYEQADVIIEQCTGLKDKNGNLIYEGDILRMKSSDGALLNYTVEWSEMECGFTITGLGQTRALNVFDGDESEIIGNIHTTDKDKQQ